MYLHNVSEITQKINDLRSLFAFSQRILPVLDDVFVFMGEVAPLLEEVNSSINESMGKIPGVASQLHNVTRATELATSEMLDHIDVAMEGLSHIKSITDRSLQDMQILLDMDARLQNLLNGMPGEEKGEMLRNLSEIVETQRNVISGLQAELGKQALATDEVRETMSGIMISLQVQDITAQQIAAVHHLVESIHDRLNALMSRLTGRAPLPQEAPQDERNLAFNGAAVYDRSGDMQALADELIAGGAGDGTSSPEAIDTLFSGKPTPGGDLSQDEINRLFGG